MSLILHVSMEIPWRPVRDKDRKELELLVWVL